MKKNKVRDLMMITVKKAVELYLAILVTEGKSPRYIEWLASRLKLFNGFLGSTGREGFKLQELSLEDGRDYLRYLMEREKRYTGLQTISNSTMKGSPTGTPRWSIKTKPGIERPVRWPKICYNKINPLPFQ